MRMLAVAPLLLAASVALAAPPAPSAGSTGAIALARLAEEQGDAALAAKLEAASAGDALVAVRASVHAAAPEALLPALAKLACGRHPVLAPEAAYAIYRIGEALRPSTLEAREALVTDLKSARAALACPGSPAPRADIAFLLEQAAALLEGVAP